MKKNILHTKAFTLIEILISMTIFAMIMVSVIMIYATVSDLTLKYDINREMRNNIKSVVEDIAEEVRKNDIEGVKNDYLGEFSFPGNGTRLKLKDGIEYRLVKYSAGNGEEYSSIDENEFKGIGDIGDCEDIKNICTIIKLNENGEIIGPLSNRKISFINLNFNVTGDTSENEIPKVTISFTARAAIKNGLKIDLIKNSKLYFQTTISERYLKIR